MMADEEISPAPNLDEHDVNAVVGMLIRVIRIDTADHADKNTINELNKGLAERAISRPRYLTGIAAFGFDMTGNDAWKRVRASIGGEAYDRAIAIARAPKLLGSVDDVADGQSPPAQSDEEPDEESAEAEQEIPKVRDAILAYLRSLPDGDGAQVPVIKDHLARTFGIETHEKTPGMTLYRLSKDQLVRRDGRTWFAIKVPFDDPTNQIETETGE